MSSDRRRGYQWAARNRIHDPDDCAGATAAFIEGCRVYAEQATARTADQSFFTNSMHQPFALIGPSTILQVALAPGCGPGMNCTQASQR